jgi:carbamate kinase
MRIVVALGGNALLRRGEKPDAETQQDNVRRAAAAIADVARAHDIVVTHGNGPQVGLLALESERDGSLSRPYPLDVIGAETEGMVGYWLERELRNALPDRSVATLLTQTVVNARDPAFESPTKFVGEVYDEADAGRHARERGWSVRRDGDYWRRVVPSPAPVAFVELDVIRDLVDRRIIVVCAGGGGIPVVRRGDELVGVEAVIDKDRAAALLAHQLGADALVMLTDVPCVQRDFGSDHAAPLTRVTSDELRGLSFPAGSMGPKVQAACDFVEAGGTFAAIGALADAAALVRGTAGTTVFASRVTRRRPAARALSA